MCALRARVSRVNPGRGAPGQRRAEENYVDRGRVRGGERRQRAGERWPKEKSLIRVVVVVAAAGEEVVEAGEAEAAVVGAAEGADAGVTPMSQPRPRLR